ncbi:MAG: hypothetical protein JRN15_12280 [Nitrososphaerota archaeon]|nr:hypothetical protein [Nitrososphaerota archaeon]
MQPNLNTPSVPPKKEAPKWFVRIGGIVGAIIGFYAVQAILNNSSTPPSSPTDTAPQAIESQQPEQTQSSPKQAPKRKAKRGLARTITGRGTSDSESFMLDGPKVKMVLKTSGTSEEIYVAARLESEDGLPLTGNSTDVTVEPGQQGRAETIVRGIASGKYYVSVMSSDTDINWEITLTEEE